VPCVGKKIPSKGGAEGRFQKEKGGLWASALPPKGVGGPSSEVGKKKKELMNAVELSDEVGGGSFAPLERRGFTREPAVAKRLPMVWNKKKFAQIVSQRGKLREKR